MLRVSMMLQNMDGGKHVCLGKQVSLTSVDCNKGSLFQVIQCHVVLGLSRIVALYFVVHLPLSVRPPDYQ